MASSLLLFLLAGTVLGGLPAFWWARAHRARADLAAAKAAVPKARLAFRTAAVKLAGWTAIALLLMIAIAAATR